MKCPNCFKDNNKVTNCRMWENQTAFYRRRECLSCGYKFTTWERYCPPEYDTPDRHPRRLERRYNYDF